MIFSRFIEGKDEKIKLLYRGNIRKFKKLLLDRFGLIFNIIIELGNREGDFCGIGVYFLI